ncbi:TIGR03885 family FMN-dependent LLM class oxidoreductase [Phytoactinopolyspora alkaliphila]|uniref:TIGR03885 family FMN-dependent LLM class oxidoreductase n=1 Tax=Phytoactinopolyspora alkaliphila TaxID=1783498 RepID=A0A6N9YLP8_9ACTN|nr:TIGR03885 family FMN-dependent LLM class oxidoreductase [Phytoactinopolyspora alkaliphila]NED95904.1 TIGR03885 family FMN-dependent LLM class oxidoreductase [Phytoactinopolyspora alkaliphila]
MTEYGYHASHEQLGPETLLETVRLAEKAGLDQAMCSDHFAPWSKRQGHSGQAWVWLGAAMATTSLRMGVVSAPGDRYHPAVLAQSAATMARMFPARFWLALGSGQALNEHVTGRGWPDKATRNKRLAECAHVMRALLAGETVSHDGLVRVDRARLWSLPEQPPPILGAAVTPPSAADVAVWSDGLITINQVGDAQADTLRAYRDAGGTGPGVLQVHLSWANDHATALEIACDQWREPILGGDVDWELTLPEHFEGAGRFIDADTVESFVRVSLDLDEHADWLRHQAELGFDRIMIHHVGKDQRPFIEAFGEHVLPQLRTSP